MPGSLPLSLLRSRSSGMARPSLLPPLQRQAPRLRPDRAAEPAEGRGGGGGGRRPAGAGPAAEEDPVADDEAAEINNNFTERQAGNMRKGSAIISVIIAIVVLLTAFGVGHVIKQVRIHRANSQAKSQPQAGLQPQQPGAAALPGGERPRTEGPPFGQRPDRQDQRPGMNDQPGRRPGGGRQQG